MLNIFIFSISDNFGNFHRRPILTKLSEQLEDTRITYFNRPKVFLNWFFKENKKTKQVGAINVRDLYCLAPVSWCYSNKLLMYLLVTLPIRFQLTLISNKSASSKTLLWFYKPDQWLYLKALNLPHYFTYYDNYRLDASYSFSHHSDYESVLTDCIKLSAASFICSHRLYQPYSDLKQVHHFPNAVDESFIEEKQGIKEHQRKVIGFVGLINHSINLELIGKICKKLPETDVMMIGPIQAKMAYELQEKHPNLKLLGEFPYQELAHKIASFDVGICPYQNAEFNRYRNPLKIYEYSSKGIVTVSSECDFYGPEGVVYIANNDQEFTLLVEEQLTKKTSKSISHRIEFARSNTWTKRVELIQKQLEKNKLISKVQNA